MAARDIRALPKLEGTVHVNIALILKFMPGYFFAPAPFPTSDPVGSFRRRFLVRPGTGLGALEDPVPRLPEAFAAWDLPNVNLFESKSGALVAFLAKQNVTEAQQKDLDFLLTLGSSSPSSSTGSSSSRTRAPGVPADAVDQIFDFMVRDFSRFAVELHGRAGTTPAQADDCLRMIRKPATDAGRAARIWANEILPLAGLYEMSP